MREEAHLDNDNSIKENSRILKYRIRCLIITRRQTLGVEEQPNIVELDMGVKEYWYETFRRVLVIPTSSDCYFLSIDVYSETSTLAMPQIHRLSIGTNMPSIIYVEYPSPPTLRGLKPKMAELVIVSSEQQGRTIYQIVNARLMYCEIKEYPSYEEVGELYNEVIKAIENRDPKESPLKTPPLVEEAYRARLKYLKNSEEN